MTRRIALAAALLAALVTTRWTLAPRYLFYIDNVNFALAVRDFQPQQNRPQPPGYPLFVALLKLLDLAIPSAKYVQLSAGAIGSLAALLAIWKLGDEMFRAPAGALAAAVLFFCPSFWLAGIADQVRTFLAAGAAVVALCVWRTWQAPAPPGWLYASAAALGIAAGFRPELLVLLFPLFGSTFVLRRFRAGTALTALAILGVVTLAWLSALWWKTGGPLGMVALFQSQWTNTSVHTSMLGGATARENLRTAVLAGYWTCVGVLSWIWAAPLAAKRIRFQSVSRQLLLLGCWFVPPFLFHTIVFTHDPDTTLDGSPALVLLGGWVLALLVRHRSRTRRALVAAVAMAINAAIFFSSPLHQGKDASYAWVRLAGSETARAIDGIRELARAGPAVVILNGSLVTARQISYYFPDQPVIDLDVDLRQRCAEPGIRDSRVPGTPGRVIWLGPIAGANLGPPFRMERGLLYADLNGPATFESIGACR